MAIRRVSLSVALLGVLLLIDSLPAGDDKHLDSLMKTLTNPKAEWADRRLAAQKLVARPDDLPADKPHPAIARFTKPTAAEAILDTMDADLRAFDALGQKDVDSIKERRHIQSDYLWALGRLGDRRMAGTLVKRAATAGDDDLRLGLAYSAFRLGEPAPLKKFASDFRAGAITLTPSFEQEDLAHILRLLLFAELPETNPAIDALAEPKHPQHQRVSREIVVYRALFQGKYLIDGDDPWFQHPFCLRILRAALDDAKKTGATWSIVDGASVERNTKTGFQGGPVPSWLSDPPSRWEKVEERRRDLAAMAVGQIVVGLPRYNPLMKDSDRRLALMKETLDRFAGAWRPTTERETKLLGRYHNEHFRFPHFIPEIRPLDRTATALDVQSGKAIFHQGGKSKRVERKLPVWGLLKIDSKTERKPRVLILQTEKDADGHITYGVIGHDGIRAAREEEFAEIKTLAQLDEEEAARKKAEKK
jgi:hypothetical protein